MRKVKSKVISAIKSLNYSFFSVFHQRVKGKVRQDIYKKISQNVKFSKNLNYRLFIIPNGRLYTDRVHDTAVIIKDKLVEKASFQFRYKGKKIINGSWKDNIIFSKGSPKMLKKINGNVFSLLTGGAGNTNYFHWLFDVLPRLHLLEKKNKLKLIDYFLLPSKDLKFQKETLSFLNLKGKKLLSSKDYRHISSKNLFLTDHPYVKKNNPTKSIHNIPLWISKWLKKKYLKRKFNNKLFPKKIYIQRDHNKKISNRELVNEKFIRKYLLSKGFKIVKLHRISFVKQIKFFHNAKFIIGHHGAGFANIIFCKPKTNIIEMKSKHTGFLYQNLSKTNNLKYTPIIGQVVGKSGKNQEDKISIPIKKLKKIF